VKEKNQAVVDAIDRQKELDRIKAETEAEEHQKLSLVLQRSKDHQLPRPTTFNGEGFFSVINDAASLPGNQAEMLIQRETAALIASDNVMHPLKGTKDQHLFKQAIDSYPQPAYSLEELERARSLIEAEVGEELQEATWPETTADVDELSQTLKMTIGYMNKERKRCDKLEATLKQKF